MTRTWTNGSGLALSAANLMSLEADIASLFAAIAAQHPTVILPEPTGADDYTVINTLAAANPTKALSFRSGRTYRIDSQLNITNPIYGNGAKLDATRIATATQLNQRYAIKASGTIASSITITTAIAKNAKAVTNMSSNAGYAVGQMVLISNDETPVVGMARTDRDKGELNTVASVDGGTGVTLKTGLIQAMGTTGLKIQRLTPLENYFIESLDITMGGLNKDHNAVEVAYGRNVKVRNLTIDGAEDCAIGLRTVMYGTIENNYVKNSTSGPLGLTGYGVCLWDGSRGIDVINNDFEDNRHHVAGGGAWPVVFVHVDNNRGRNSISASYDCHESCFYWWFTRNTAEGGTHGMFLRGQYITAEDNEIRGMSAEMIGVHTWDGVTEQKGIKLWRNRGYDCAYGISVGKTGTEDEYTRVDIEVIGNYLEECGINPIRVRDYDGLKATDNTIVGGTLQAMLFEGLSAAVPGKNLTCSDNNIKGHGTVGIHVKYFNKAKAHANVIVGGSAEGIYFEGDATTKSTNLTYGGNDIDTPGASGIRVLNVNDVNGSTGEILTPTINGIWYKDCSRTNTTGVTVRANAQYGIFYDGGIQHVLGNPHVSGGTGSSPAYDAVRVSGVTDLSITGGFLASPRYAVYTTTSDWISVIGTDVHTTSNATKINSDATNKVITPVL